MQTFKQLLDELDATLRQYNMSEYKKLQSPLENGEIDKYLFDFGIDDEKLKMLFQWKNGEKKDSNCQITEYGGLQSLQLIKEFAIDRPFDTSLIEIISDNGEESILFNKKPGTHYGKLYMYSVGQLYIKHPISYFDSLDSMIKTVMEAYKTKAFKYDTEERWLNIDFNKYTSIAKRMNPLSSYWKKHNPLNWKEWYEI